MRRSHTRTNRVFRLVNPLYDIEKCISIGHCIHRWFVNSEHTSIIRFGCCSCRVRVCRCWGCCCLSLCVCDLLIFLQNWLNLNIIPFLIPRSAHLNAGWRYRRGYLGCPRPRGVGCGEKWHNWYSTILFLYRSTRENEPLSCLFNCRLEIPAGARGVPTPSRRWLRGKVA